MLASLPDRHPRRQHVVGVRADAVGVPVVPAGLGDQPGELAGDVGQPRQRGQLAGTTAEGSTEDLRLALRAYRQFVDRLLGLAS
jgi:hypothetical protein